MVTGELTCLEKLSSRLVVLDGVGKMAKFGITSKVMVVTYHLEETELDENFYQQLKSQFKNKKLSITVAEEMDETEYLLASPANAERLLKAIANVNNGELIILDINALNQPISN